MKNLLANILIFLFIASWGGMLGYIWYDTTNEMIGGVRSRSTGFYMNSGENFAIGTSTPTLGDIHIYKTSTSTVIIGGTILGCLGLYDGDTDQIDYYRSFATGIATTSAAECGF